MGPVCLLSQCVFEEPLVFCAEYTDHMDCFVEMRKDRPLDCFGIYPQVLPLAFNWLHQQKNLTISEYDDQLDMSYYSDEQLIYWGWTHHMYMSNLRIELADN